MSEHDKTQPWLQDRPFVPVALPDIPGGEENLLPISALQQPLRVEFAMWGNSMPSPATPEVLRCYWDDREVAEKTWTAPVQPHDLHIEIEPAYLLEGQHRLYYELSIWNGTSDRSETLTLSIDRTAPQLGSDNGPLVFPDEVLAGGVTDAWLQANDDQLKALLPAYHTVRPGDTLSWYWEVSPLGSHLAGECTLTEEDIDAPLTLTFPGEQIRERGDGQRFALYEVRDRAGNLSRLSRAVELSVAATPVPRFLPAPTVDKAVSTGSEQSVLDPKKATAGVRVVIPEEAQFHDGDQLTVQWAEPGSPGACQIAVPVSPGSREYAVAAGNVAPQMGKSIPVYYCVTTPDEELPSQRHTLSVQSLPTSGFPTIQCTQAAGSASLSLAQVPMAGADLRLAKWMFIAAGQRISIRASGVSASGGATEYPVLNNHEITLAQVTAGVAALLPRAWLAQLRLNNRFRLLVAVSFDGGLSEFAFPLLDLNLTG